MDRERATATFPTHILSAYLYDGADKLAKFKRIADLVAAEPAFNRDDMYFLDREQAIGRALQKLARLMRIRKEMNLTEQESHWLFMLVDEVFPVTTHFGMFIPTIKSQGAVGDNHVRSEQD